MLILNIISVQLVMIGNRALTTFCALLLACINTYHHKAKNMKIFVFLLIALFPFIGFATEDSAYDRVITKNEITCGIMAWAPFAEIDPNTKEWNGLTVGIMRKAFATLDMKVRFKEVTPGNQVQDLNNGRIDAVWEIC
jgi:ABC-type amino acid transport substrate-binding protein